MPVGYEFRRRARSREEAVHVAYRPKTPIWYILFLTSNQRPASSTPLSPVTVHSGRLPAACAFKLPSESLTAIHSASPLSTRLSGISQEHLPLTASHRFCAHITLSSPLLWCLLVLLKPMSMLSDLLLLTPTTSPRLPRRTGVSHHPTLNNSQIVFFFSREL